MWGDKYPKNPVDLRPYSQIQIRFLRVSSGIKTNYSPFAKITKRKQNKKLRNKRSNIMKPYSDGI